MEIHPDWLIRIEAKLDRVAEQTTKNAAILEEHIRRTEILEKIVLTPEKYDTMGIVFKILGATGFIGALAGGVAKALGKF